MHHIIFDRTFNEWGIIFVLLGFKPSIVNIQKLIFFGIEDFTNLDIIHNVAIQFGHLYTTLYATD